MKSVKALFQFSIAVAGLKFGSYWPYNYTGSDHEIVLVLSLIVLINALIKIKNLINN